MYRLLLLPLLLFCSKSNAISVSDDLGRQLEFSQAARRIVSLAPHITENLFAAGAGENIVGAVKYSDYPEAAKSIPVIGGYNNFNIESVIALKPDLVIAWKEGNLKHQVDRLISLGLNVYISAPDNLEDIAKNIYNYGVLTDNSNTANRERLKYLSRLSTLREQYSSRKPVTVFYQTWHQPLITVNDRQFIGQIITLCGGKNIFSDLDSLTPQISVETVLDRNPQAIVASGMGEARPDWLDAWKKWSFLEASRNNHLFFIPPPIIQRHTPRLLEGASLLCDYLNGVRVQK